MKLYHAPNTRSIRPRWLLEEIGVPYELVRLDMAKGEHKSPEYLRLHPHGAVPAFVDGSLALFESAAICAYLADKYIEMGFAPPFGTPERGTYYQWMFYSMATLEPPVIQILAHTVMLPAEQRSAAAAEEGRNKFADIATVLNAALAGKSFILGEKFSAADVMIGSTLSWARMMGALGNQPEVDAYLQRLFERPALHRAQAD